MPWGKKKSYNLMQSTNKQKKAPATNGFHSKVNSSSSSPISSTSSTNSSKGLVRKSDIPKQVKNISKLKKIL